MQTIRCPLFEQQDLLEPNNQEFNLWITQRTELNILALVFLVGLDLQTFAKCPFFRHLSHVAFLAGHKLRKWCGRPQKEQILLTVYAVSCLTEIDGHNKSFETLSSLHKLVVHEAAA